MFHVRFGLWKKKEESQESEGNRELHTWVVPGSVPTECFLSCFLTLPLPSFGLVEYYVRIPY